jgi:poly(3-hydroxybutyrate) depolymerase
VLQLHGTADVAVPYTSTAGGIGAVGAEGSVAQWASHNGCGTARTAGASFDLDNAVVGAETTPSVTAGCPADGAVELWRMEGSGHIPNLASGFGTTLLAWFVDHRRS